VYKIAVGDRTQ